MLLLWILYLHFLACLYYYIMNLNKSWVPPCESLGLGAAFYEAGGTYRYATMIYYAVQLYLINETSPTVLYERQFVASVAIFSAIVNANIFGSITVLVQQLNAKQVKF